MTTTATPINQSREKAIGPWLGFLSLASSGVTILTGSFFTFVAGISLMALVMTLGAIRCNRQGYGLGVLIGGMGLFFVFFTAPSS